MELVLCYTFNKSSKLLYVRNMYCCDDNIPQLHSNWILVFSFSCLGLREEKKEFSNLN